jgi:hypothetical protein
MTIHNELFLNPNRLQLLITCDFKFTKQQGGIVIVDELLIVRDEKVFGHLRVVRKSTGDEMIH